METNEVLDNEMITERKNPVTMKSVAGLIAVIVAALLLCGPFVKNPGAKQQPVKTVTAVEQTVNQEASMF